MMSDQIESFINGLIQKTIRGNLIWKSLDNLNAWKKICEEIQESKEADLKTYYISVKESYYLKNSNGYVFLLNARYSSATIFSPALDRKFLIIKINPEIPLVNLCNYNGEDGFNKLLTVLYEEVQNKKTENVEMPDAMYSFFNNILNGE